jgi:hypothetical protein
LNAEGAIFVTFLDPFRPPWAEELVREMDGVFPNPVIPLEVEMDLRPAYFPERNQYHAALILASLLRGSPSPARGFWGSPVSTSSSPS